MLFCLSLPTIALMNLNYFCSDVSAFLSSGLFFILEPLRFSPPPGLVCWNSGYFGLGFSASSSSTSSGSYFLMTSCILSWVSRRYTKSSCLDEVLASCILSRASSRKNWTSQLSASSLFCLVSSSCLSRWIRLWYSFLSAYSIWRLSLFACSTRFSVSS